MSSGAQVEEIFVGRLNFNPNLQFGYRKRTELEPFLLDAQEKIKWAEHIVLIYPVWWPVGITNIGPIRLSKNEFRQKWLKKIEALGSAQK